VTSAGATSASIADELAAIEREALARASSVSDLDGLEAVRVAVLGKKGELTRVLRGLSQLPPDERPAIGSAANRVKAAIEEAIAERDRALRASERDARLAGPQLDVTLPPAGQPHGHIHPLSAMMEDICDVLCGMGFEIVEGPEVEDEYHNVEALNIQADHPARDMPDTLFVDGGWVLRTHTSPVQIRTMETRKPPLMIIAPGAVYRHDDDVTHSPMFHQVEGLMVDRGVTFRHLKGVLTTFLRQIFGANLPVRFRASYFPFTEPSAEVDIGCVLCGGSGSSTAGACRVCKRTGWLEILGCGMVHPAVFEAVGYDPEDFSGFAFGLGVERIAMLKNKIDDIRLLYGNDLRFLEQF